MRALLLLILSFSFVLGAIGQTLPDSLGFTNKAEAKNQMVSGLKEGKWVEYTKNDGIVTFDYWFTTPDTNAPFYILTIYKSGIRTGTVRQYYRSGNLLEVTHFTDEFTYGLVRTYFENGQLMWDEPPPDSDGIVKEYYENGVLEQEYPIINGKMNGIDKRYYQNGKLNQEDTYSNDTLNGVEKNYYYTGGLVFECPYKKGKKNGIEKEYYEDGKIKSESSWSDGILGAIKNFDENGKEIKR